MVEIVELSAREAVAASDELAELFIAAFAAPPYNRGAVAASSFPISLERHAGRAGFRCMVARAAGAPVGFGYGYTSAPGQWWHDIVAGALGRVAARRWLLGAFELAELAVTPDWQGRGVGGRLHDALLAGLRQRTAVLSTIAEETAGSLLYRRRGWLTLHPGVSFPGTPTPYMIMGRDL